MLIFLLVLLQMMDEWVNGETTFVHRTVPAA